MKFAYQCYEIPASVFARIVTRNRLISVVGRPEERFMTTLTEIESAVGTLSPEQKQSLYRFLEGQIQEAAGQVLPRRSVLEIAPVHLGPVLCPFSTHDDLLDEMLEMRA